MWGRKWEQLLFRFYRCMKQSKEQLGNFGGSQGYSLEQLIVLNLESITFPLKNMAAFDTSIIFIVFKFVLSLFAYLAEYSLFFFSIFQVVSDW